MPAETGSPQKAARRASRGLGAGPASLLLSSAHEGLSPPRLWLGTPAFSHIAGWPQARGAGKAPHSSVSPGGHLGESGGRPSATPSFQAGEACDVLTRNWGGSQQAQAASGGEGVARRLEVAASELAPRAVKQVGAVASLSVRPRGASACVQRLHPTGWRTPAEGDNVAGDPNPADPAGCSCWGCSGFLSIQRSAWLHFSSHPRLAAIFTYLRQKELSVGGQIIFSFISPVTELKWQEVFHGLTLWCSAASFCSRLLGNKKQPPQTQLKRERDGKKGTA